MSAEDSKKQRTKRPGPGSAGGRPREDNSADDEEDDEFSNTKAMHGVSFLHVTRTRTLADNNQTIIFLISRGKAATDARGRGAETPAEGA